MVNFRLCLFTISSITLTFTLQPFHVLSDEAMIINVCDKTPDLSLCQTCLNSDPKSKTADFRGLAMISITCGTRDADKLYNDTYNLFIGARNGIDGAGRLTITRNVIPMITFCSDHFKKNPEVAVPKFIIDETNVVSTDCQIILGILNNF
ncbi:hypothetical protein ES332_D11G352900v1 [Gossypium tomentosum]|uniref:Pectinesterase inhibitor domain-containing protein n=1 Tax=Gossypium tomentosum TaxID=34277 RepID=A0A5D2IVE6_GOSTO|nr:hypothetical protein ES332_D11G352300v1 [Gossypium tomentosum]TYH46648.1 hypothetical protein ES332_D11G352900v1 [Gossypium tomentosum]